MKFLHLSDIRLGNSAESGTRWETDRLGELEEGLRRVLAEAEAGGAELILISGGLFSHVPVSSELEELARVFAEYPAIEVCITGGATDPVRPSSPVRSFSWPANVHCAADGGVQHFLLERLDTEVFAASVTELGCALPAEVRDAAEALSKEREHAPRIRIAVLSEGKDEDLIKAFRDAGFTYVAAGGSQERRDIGPAIRCPGYFEPEKLGDSGSHGLFEGSISPRSGRLESLEFKPMASAAYVPLLVKTTTRTTAEEVAALIRKEIERRGSANIYRIKLTGTRAPEVRFDLGPIRAEFRVSEVIDETEPEYDFRELFAAHPQDLIGFYVTKLASDNHEMSRLEKRAMYYGLDTLIRSSEETKS